MYDTYDTDVTVYRYGYDKQTRKESWTRVQVRGVSWHGGQKVTVGESGLNTADAYTVRIPAPAVPEGLAVANGDVVAKGLLEVEITRAAEITGQYESFVVTAVYDNRRGVPAARHLRIEGK